MYAVIPEPGGAGEGPALPQPPQVPESLQTSAKVQIEAQNVSTFFFKKALCTMAKTKIIYQKSGRLGSNEFHIKWIIGTHGNWKNQNPGIRFGATS